MHLEISLEKYHGNPILKPNPANRWESQAVFNAGALYHNGQFHMLYRAIGEYEQYISRLGYAVSDDGVHFKRVSDEPVLFPEFDYERWGCEDPRIMLIDGTVYVTYVALDRGENNEIFPLTALATTDDFLSYEKHGLINPAISINKDCVIFPEKIGGRYMMLHRPHNWTTGETRREDGRLMIKRYNRWLPWDQGPEPERFPEKPAIWAAYSDNFTDWDGHHVLMESMFPWENEKIGGGCPPIKTDHGWLHIYHGVGVNSDGRRIYRGGAALLDLDDPATVLHRSEHPILAPECDYECQGDVPWVVFPEGAVLLEDGQLFVYYGGGDKCLNLARGTVRFY